MDVFQFGANKNSRIELNETNSQTTRQNTGRADDEPHKFRLISWNIDGLNTDDLESRTKGVCDVINKEKPEVVFLQEVIPISLEFIKKDCPSYQVIPAFKTRYFTAILLRIADVKVEGSMVVPFFGSTMSRNLLTVKCIVKDVKLHLMTSHLESTKDSSTERKKQLLECFERVLVSDKDRTVIFGGDMNLRDTEVAELGGIPRHILDLWEVTGERPEVKFTWDMTKNDNMEFSGNYKPSYRFDRLFIRHSQPNRIVTPVHFELVGRERLPCRRFPSDHWGILAHFDI